jgi:hypothetical protein
VISTGRLKLPIDNGADILDARNASYTVNETTGDELEPPAPVDEPAPSAKEYGFCANTTKEESIDDGTPVKEPAASVSMLDGNVTPLTLPGTLKDTFPLNCFEVGSTD